MTYEKIMEFCDKDFSRHPTTVPIQIGDWLYATDGVICIRAKGVALPDGFGVNPPEGYSVWPEPTEKIIHRLQKIFESAPDCFARVGNIPPQNPVEECPGCFGDGYFKCEHCTHENQCPTCGGEKEVREDIFLMADGVILSLKEIYRIAGFLNLEIAIEPSRNLDPIHFRFDGGEGVLMPCKPNLGLDCLLVNRETLEAIPQPIRNIGDTP